ncbi:LOW QUALITY PROTEIN: UDP-glucuronosyltransferase 3A1-like [Rana temporaria]|uniref:LOW QUALITY PROTEIN: UDP-glucuronosyltransferase 3A1-like n=1 Tax=Rana temporaria TaxID=8407 RepID=UPI001AACF378|nr:LOW QUALITY PROTEIN: UDP-glucuronosyltransferase 3A1-like [Rana temporaria]
MAACKKQTVFLLVFALHFLFIGGAKILTICFLGGSHYLLMDEISGTLQNNGHEVRMFLQYADQMPPGYKRPTSPYPVTTFSLDEKFLQEFMVTFIKIQKAFLQGRNEMWTVLTLMNTMSYQCNLTLHQSEIMNFLRGEHYDIAVVDAFDPCAMLVCEKLGLPFIAFFPTFMANAHRVGMPSPLSYIPLFQTQLTDHMDFFGRLKNTLVFLASLVIQTKMDSFFDGVIEEHFPAESRPTIADLHLKAELWLYNVDFTLEFPRPLLPHVQYIGGLLAKPVKPISQELEDFISESGDAGFIVVTLGSMLSSLPVVEFMKEMNGGFAKIQEKVIWRYQRSNWPQDVEISPNVKIMDWVPQNDLLGHPKLRLFVAHGGMNGLMEAVYHGVPVLGIPLFGDQIENMVRVKAKQMGTFILPDQLKADNFASTIRHIIENKCYKTSAMKLQAIRRSQPFPPDQQLLRWVEHIIQSGGGGHLHPYSYKLPWYQYWLLDVILFLFVILTVAIYLIVTLFGALIRKCCSPGKLKRN